MGFANTLWGPIDKLTIKKRSANKATTIIIIEREEKSRQCFEDARFISKFTQNWGRDFNKCKVINKQKIEGIRISKKAKSLECIFYFIKGNFEVFVSPAFIGSQGLRKWFNNYFKQVKLQDSHTGLFFILFEIKNLNIYYTNWIYFYKCQQKTIIIKSTGWYNLGKVYWILIYIDIKC